MRLPALLYLMQILSIPSAAHIFNISQISHVTSTVGMRRDKHGIATRSCFVEIDSVQFEPTLMRKRSDYLAEKKCIHSCTNTIHFGSLHVYFCQPISCSFRILVTLIHASFSKGLRRYRE